MICRPLTAGFGLLVDSQRQGRDGFRDHAHTGVDRGHLHGVLGVDRFACVAGTEEEGRRGGDGVAGLVPGMEQADKGVFQRNSSLRNAICIANCNILW